MRIHVAFTPAEPAPAPIGVVVDVLRATSTIAQALASGYRRVLCCAEIEEALALRAEIPDSLVGGERKAVQVEGFDVGASPREFLEPRAETLILSTTNGTRAILETAQRCEEVVLGSLLNLDAVARASAGARRGDRLRRLPGRVRARRRVLRGAHRAARGSRANGRGDRGGVDRARVSRTRWTR